MIDWFGLLVVQGESSSQESSTPQFESIKCFSAGCIFYFVNDLCISSHATLWGNLVTFGILNLRHFESRNSMERKIPKGGQGDRGNQREQLVSLPQAAGAEL